MNVGTKDEISDRANRKLNWDGWAMLLLASLFILLYSAALVGWLRPLADITMLARLEPLIFLIIGYYFGRLPGHQNERFLREDSERAQTKADAAQRQKEVAQTERESIEEKIRNARIALRSELLTIETEGKNQNGNGNSSGSISDARYRSRAIETAINILNS